MFIYQNRPKDNWLSPYTIVEKIIFWREIEYKEPMVKFWHDVLEPFCNALFAVRNFINRDIRYVKIDPWDTWSMDNTLTHIILPMLIQLKKTKHGAPHIDDVDVPSNLRSTTKSAQKAKKNILAEAGDGNWFKRWDYVLSEMIWAFTELNKEDWADQFWSGNIDHIWIDLPDGGAKLKKGPKHTLKFDKKGHDKHWARIQNGLRLFGKYYTALWD